MDFRLTDDQLELQAGVEQFCAGDVHARGARRDGARRAATRTRGRRSATSGCSGCGAPEADGGLGLGWVETVVVYEVLGAHLVPGPLVWSQLAGRATCPGAADGTRVVDRRRPRTTAGPLARRAPRPRRRRRARRADGVVLVDADAVGRGLERAHAARPAHAGRPRRRSCPTGRPWPTRAPSRRCGAEGTVLVGRAARRDRRPGARPGPCVRARAASSSADRSARSRPSSTCSPTCTCGRCSPAARPTPPRRSSTTAGDAGDRRRRGGLGQGRRRRRGDGQRPRLHPGARRHGLHVGDDAPLPVEADVGARALVRRPPPTTPSRSPPPWGARTRELPTRRSSTTSTTASRRSRSTGPTGSTRSAARWSTSCATRTRAPRATTTCGRSWSPPTAGRSARVPTSTTVRDDGRVPYDGRYLSRFSEWEAPQEATPPFRSMAKPVIVGVNGICCGAGLDLVTTGDIVIASERGRVLRSAREHRPGVRTRDGAARPRAAAQRRDAGARSSASTNGSSAQRAYDLGLVTEVVRARRTRRPAARDRRRR